MTLAVPAGIFTAQCCAYLYSGAAAAMRRLFTAACCAEKYPLPTIILKTPALICAGGALKRCCQGCTGEVPRRGHNGRVPSLVCFFFCHFFLHKQKEMARSP